MFRVQYRDCYRTKTMSPRLLKMGISSVMNLFSVFFFFSVRGPTSTPSIVKTTEHRPNPSL